MSEPQAAVAADSVLPSETNAQEPASPPWVSAKHKLKVDGGEVELSYDELVREAQRGRSADKRYQDAARMKQSVSALVDEFKSGKLDKLIELAGEDVFRKASEQYLLKWLEDEQLPEDTKKARELERKYKQLEDEHKGLKERAEQEQRSVMEQRAVQEIDSEIAEAVKATGRKPTPRLVARIAEHMLATLESKDAKMSAGDAVSRTVSDFREDIAEFLRDMPAAEIRKLLPKEALEALRKADVELVSSQSPRVAPKQGSAPQRQANGKARMGSDEFFKKIEQRFGG